MRIADLSEMKLSYVDVSKGRATISLIQAAEGESADIIAMSHDQAREVVKAILKELDKTS
jgi:hypothetical protein